MPYVIVFNILFCHCRRLPQDQVSAEGGRGLGLASPTHGGRVTEGAPAGAGAGGSGVGVEVTGSHRPDVGVREGTGHSIGGGGLPSPETGQLSGAW